MKRFLLSGLLSFYFAQHKPAILFHQTGFEIDFLLDFPDERYIRRQIKLKKKVRNLKSGNFRCKLGC
jgi:hypothetical protein